MEKEQLLAGIEDTLLTMPPRDTIRQEIPENLAWFGRLLRQSRSVSPGLLLLYLSAGRSSGRHSVVVKHPAEPAMITTRPRAAAVRSLSLIHTFFITLAPNAPLLHRQTTLIRVNRPSIHYHSHR